jgi:cysteine desulfurase
VHGFGREARKRLEEARASLLAAVKGEGYRLVFTASGTEANNLALKGLAGYTVLVSAIEHLSVLKSAEGAVIIPVDRNGVVDLAALKLLLEGVEGPKLVSVMLAGNETGLLQPVAEIVALAHSYGALVHSDAVQLLGKVPLDVGSLGLDMVTISAHKCGGPHGIGALIIRKNLPLAAIIHGGGQELGFRAGTENLAGAVGFAAAVPDATWMVREQQRLRGLQEQLENALADQALVFGGGAERLAGTCSLAMPGVPSETQLIHFDLEGIALSSGSACSSGR